MNDDYENVEWNVHATSDAYTVPFDPDDPLSAFGSSEYTNNDPFGQESFHSHSSTPPQQPPYSFTPTTSPANHDESIRQHTATAAAAPPPAPFMNGNAASPSFTEYEPKPMTIRISDPLKHTDAQGAYVSYLITTTTRVETFASPNPRPVRRRFQDFVWLHNALLLEFPACIVPPLPEKHRLEYIKGDRFGSEFIERRRIGLQWFLDRIARHPELQQSQCTRVFLESTDFKNDKRMQSRRVPPASSVLESLSDTLLNAFSRIKKPDERFVDTKDVIDKLEDNLNTVERLYSRIDLQQDYTSFAASIQSLSQMETGISEPLHRFAETTKAYASAMSEMTRSEDLLFLNDVHELLAYCQAAKAVLRARDQKQVDFEELSAYLHRTIRERERTLHPNRGGGGGGGLNIGEFVADKLNEVRGIDMQRARREKLARLERKIKELEGEVARTNDISNAFSNQVLKEFEVFQRTKTKELKDGLTAYADSHIKFYQKGVSIWENILPVLESIELSEEEQPI